MKLKLIAGAIIAVNLSACATITKGKTNEVKISSTPSEANVSIAEITNRYPGAECVTPCAVKLNRKGSYETTISKEGHSSFTTILVPKFSASGGAGLAGNLLVGGIIGAGVDAATGATKDLSPNLLTVTLMPSGQESFATDKKGNKIVPNTSKAKDEDAAPESSDTGSSDTGESSDVEESAEADT